MLNAKMIGNKIAKARKKKNISQAQLAEHLFISSQAVGKWERGESMPDIITLNRLVEILGFNLNYFSETIRPEASETPPGESSEPPVTKLAAGEQNKEDNAGEKLNGDMSHGNWVEADFSGLKDLHEKFSSSNLLRCKFNGSNLSGLLLKGNNVDSCDFSESDLSNSHIQGSNLADNLFKNCTLKGADFLVSNIERCNFSGTNFSGTKFSKSFINGCHLSGANFSGVVFKSGGITGVAATSDDMKTNPISCAVLNHTSFIDTHIVDIVFVSALEQCYFENCKFTRVIFRNETLVNTLFKNNKNLKRVQSVDCKADKMTYEFLKQGKADVAGITLLASTGGNE